MGTDVNKEQSILVPTDFSEACDNALNHAIGLSKHLSTKIYLLHVITKDSLSFFTKDSDEELPDLGTPEAKKLIEDELASYIETKNAENIRGLAIEGDIFTTISGVAAEFNASMIVLGTHGKVGFQKLTGSYALKVIDSTDVPVLTVQKKGYTGGYKNLVFPISLSDDDRQKAKDAIKIAKAFDSIIHILPKKESGETSKTKMTSRVNQLKNYFDNYEVKYVDVNPQDYGDDFAKQILNYSVSTSADMILILTDPKKHGGLFGEKEELLMFNGAQIPVLCVNALKTTKSALWAGVSVKIF